MLHVIRDQEVLVALTCSVFGFFGTFLFANSVVGSKKKGRI